MSSRSFRRRNNRRRHRPEGDGEGQGQKPAGPQPDETPPQAGDASSRPGNDASSRQDRQRQPGQENGGSSRRGNPGNSRQGNAASSRQRNDASSRQGGQRQQGQGNAASSRQGPRRGRGRDGRPGRAPEVVLPPWPELPLVFPDCPVCGKSVRDLPSALTHRVAGKPAHFDCVVQELRESNEVAPQEKICYLGGGSFGIIELRPAGGPSRFVIRKRIQYEEKEKPQEWKKTLQVPC